jgi:hypothetical protein
MAQNQENRFWLTYGITNFEATPGVKNISPAGAKRCRETIR